jgi:sortase A
MKRKLLVIIPAVLLLLIAGCVTVYPLVANYVNDKYQSVVRTDYAREIEEMDTSTLDAARAAAQSYNDNLSPLRYNKEAVQLASVDYDSLLNLNGSGIMGYVEIPKLNVNLPIYHGTGEQVLEKGVGHLTGSSLPIGGEGCHPILTGHSGVAGKRLFSDLDQLHAGDVFYLHILGDTLAYQVAEINQVLPYETDLLSPVAGEDLCTLVTCYPYGVNSHRLLVRGSRIPYTEAAEIEERTEDEPVKSTWQEQYRLGLMIGGGAAAVAVAAGLAIAWLRKKRRARHEA